MLAKLADVLRVKDFADLLGRHAPTAALARPEHPALGDLRRAIVSFGSVGLEAPVPSLTALRDRIRQAWQLRSVSHRDRTDLAALLPGMVIDAQRVCRSARRPSDQRDAYRLLAEVYHLGQLYLCYQDATELLWIVVDRAMGAALESEDPVTIGRAAWFSAYLYRDFGSIDQAHQIVEDAQQYLDAAEQNGQVLQQRSAVQLASAWNHARDSRPALAWRAWDAAVDAARDSRMPTDSHALFGATIDDLALTLDVELGKGSSAMRRAEATNLDAVASTPRLARLMIEMARALMLRGDYSGALHLLRSAYSTSSEATLFSMHARSMTNDLLTKAGPLLRSDATELAEKLGVAA